MKPQSQEKAEKAARASVGRLINSIKSDFSFKRIQTVADYLVKGLGYTPDACRTKLHYHPDELTHKLTFPELKDRLEDLRLGFEAEWFLKKNPPVLDKIETNGHTPALAQTTVTIPDNEIQKASEILDKENNYGLEPSAKEKAFLFWFQKKYATEILNKIRIYGLRAVLLIAQAGTGKTFILGAVIRRLIDSKFNEGKSISPWPFCYITKASVVEQTKRVLEKQFAIDTVAECFVTNYDQMRADFGRMFVSEKTIVERGVEEISWQWRPVVHPCVLVFDECQAAKNADSTQSKIVCAVAEINHPHVYVIFSSATPFTRVSEAKYFVLNCRLERKMF